MVAIIGAVAVVLLFVFGAILLHGLFFVVAFGIIVWVIYMLIQEFVNEEDNPYK